ncbi:E3 ubiquitin-protein ligase RMA1H1 [Linum grandiflorum]
MDWTLMEELHNPNRSNKSCRRKQGSSVSETVMESGEEEEEGSNICSSNGFDCNICLDSVMDPVVTLCGHLYCWPCIYKWLNSATLAGDDEDNEENYYSDLRTHSHCPVCKSEISESSLIPLFSQGQTSDGGMSATPKSAVPRRPPAPLRNSSPSPRPGLRRRRFEQSMVRSGGLELSGRVPIPVVGMLGEIVFAGNYTPPYQLDGDGSNISPRVRRQMMAADKSLSRVCFFLVCCVFMCIVLF